MTAIKMKYTLAILALWLIAVVTTAVLVRGTGLFTYLGPLYAICMIGSLSIVWKAQRDAVDRSRPKE